MRNSHTHDRTTKITLGEKVKFACRPRDNGHYSATFWLLYVVESIDPLVDVLQPNPKFLNPNLSNILNVTFSSNFCCISIRPSSTTLLFHVNRDHWRVSLLRLLRAVVKGIIRRWYYFIFCPHFPFSVTLILKKSLEYWALAISSLNI